MAFNVVDLLKVIEIDVHQGAMDREQRDHLAAIVWDDEGMGLTGWLEDIAVLGGDPVMFQVVPAAPEHEGMNLAGMAVSLQHAAAPDPQQVEQARAQGQIAVNKAKAQDQAALNAQQFRFKSAEKIMENILNPPTPPNANL